MPVEAFVLTVLAYVLAHGLTARIVTPVQSQLLPEVTVFASLVYLPHGVRVLASWLMGWWAFFALLLGAYISHVLFTPEADQALLAPVLWPSLAVGAASALGAFAILRIVGFDAPSKNGRKMRWRFLMVAGAVASILNSAGQSLVHSGLIVPDNVLQVSAVYALGDLIGLIVCMFALMIVFRWLRIFAKRA